jgi:hypothetical protein
MFAWARAAGVNAASARRTIGSIPGKGMVPGAAGDNPTGESIGRSEIAIWTGPTPISSGSVQSARRWSLKSSRSCCSNGGTTNPDSSGIEAEYAATLAPSAWRLTIGLEGSCNMPVSAGEDAGVVERA